VRNDAPAIQHGALNRGGAKPALRLEELSTPWHGWRYTSEAARSKRWIESYLRLPTGAGAGSKMRVASFQRKILSELYDSLASFVSLPAANGKTTFLAAVALERICRGDAYAEVDVLATKEDQAGILVETAKRFVEASEDLVPLVAWHAHAGILEYRPTGSRIAAHPAKLSAIQGLNFSLAIVDEIGFAEDPIVESILARLGKRPDSHAIGIGTPGFRGNVLQRVRSQHLDGELPAGVTFLEWAATAGADVHDRAEWRRANPALAEGFLREVALELQAAMLSEIEFRTYHLGQWIEDDSGSWLPAGAWDACPNVPPPPEGTEIVVAIDGTYRRTSAVVLSTLSGELAFGYSAEAPTDEELERVVLDAATRYRVLEVSYPRRLRPNLFANLADAGIPVEPWDSTPDEEARATSELYRAILEGRVAHDHDGEISAAMGAVRVRLAADGSIRLARPDRGDVDAALAARAAWWRARALEGDYADGNRSPIIY
jgi:phage terminase large subunit-like protein